MAERFEFDEFNGRRTNRAPHCVGCEEMLADALDESLGESEQAWFDGHVRSCAACSEMLADARRGAAWLEMLKTPRPEPSARLMEKILAETSGATTGETSYQPQMVPAAAPVFMPGVTPANVLAFRPRVARLSSWSRPWFEPRLAMTAAMAFFSIALTLNLTGVQLDRVHVSALKPANMKHTYYAAEAEATRYYDNLRVVRVMESRVDDLKAASADVLGGRDREAQPEDTPGAKPGKPEARPEDRKKPEDGPGVSRHEAPASRSRFVTTGMTIRRGGEPAESVNKMRAEGGLV